MFPTQISFVIFDDVDQLEKHIGNRISRNFYAMTSVIEKYKYKLKGKVKYAEDVVTVFFKPEKLEEYTLQDLCHESVHVTNRIFVLVGYRPKRLNDECQAYLTAHIFNEMYEFIGESIKEEGEKL